MFKKVLETSEAPKELSSERSHSLVLLTRDHRNPHFDTHYRTTNPSFGSSKMQLRFKRLYVSIHVNAKSTHMNKFTQNV